MRCDNMYNDKKYNFDRRAWLAFKIHEWPTRRMFAKYCDCCWFTVIANRLRYAANTIFYDMVLRTCMIYRRVFK